jgi:3-deoxy-manno-octulosonate cytidylyltransferase (CMP-KDO synthetase)
MRPIIIIPARMGSTRLPGKPLADIAGKPMIAHVVQRALEADIGPVVVATDDGEILHAAEVAGARVVMTGDHASGSDRAYAALKGCRHDIIVNLQGDMPFIKPADIRLVISALERYEVEIGTLAAKISDADKRNPNVVKLVGLPIGYRRVQAIYFERNPDLIFDWPMLRHIGVYAYRRGALDRFTSLSSEPSEQNERLEQLRAIEDGMRIDAMLVDAAPVEVNTPEDLAAVRGAERPIRYALDALIAGITHENLHGEI